MSTQVISVGEYLELVNQTLKYIPSATLQVEGEVSDYRVAQGKWVSFDLKDETTEAVLKCFMTTWQLKTPLEDGMRVQVKGYPKVYERFGTFKMNVQDVELVGEGALRRAYELLKKKLETEGLFDISRKRSLTRFPQRIGLITSRDAAAYGDFIRILNNRWGGVHLLFAHVHVQGKEAVGEIVEAFSFFNKLSSEQRPDVLVLTRGGGGLEDLHAFNDEDVARAIYASVIPVVCAVGHERDESLADFVADVRASTPSNAAERVVPSRQDVLYEIETLTRHMESRLSDVIQDYSYVIERATQLIGFILEQQKQRLLRATEGILFATQQWFMRMKTKREAYERILRQVDPKRVLSRGYSLVFSHGTVVKEATQLEVGGEITVQFASSLAEARVLRINGKGQQKLV
ncbi:MAG: Exodeoxyribonuclease 7 large subunit [Candidatus Uhrbacteria bacterium GW2011_GWF2_39_13]|uniref:Exodeoxyribonuclease 7 large subunit n=1 Tax=Candidatus Uhrbacteria bacterium GW2011_GWF2_39_13 TaxID=1618995 RepID=A0A0G0Q342_9BACT|nr:MAG: Exodeoxyribonuclease 7 large subunit [Candidatus Uhrbacteria bacterium GW2011_GWF2_39_13]HAU66260.1 exodeoxyribonuclease VII large subunit [Candidatus Uhrbacteria bacterium]